MAAVPLVIPLLYLAAFMVAYGFLVVYRGQSEDADGGIKGLLLWLAGVVGAVRIPIPGHSVRVFGPLADSIRWVANMIEHALAAAVGWFEAPVAQFWHLLAEVPAQTADALARFATNTAHKLVWIERSYVPQFVNRALGGALAPLAALAAKVRYMVAHTIPALEHGLDWTRDRVGNLERDAARAGRRLRRVEGILTKAGIVALVAAALGRLGLKWLRCRNVNRLGKGACAMDFDLLESLLAGTLLVVGSISLVDFAHELQAIEGEAVAAINGLVREA